MFNRTQSDVTRHVMLQVCENVTLWRFLCLCGWYNLFTM